MEKKIAKWLEEGLIDKSTALKLLADVKEDKARLGKIKMSITVYTIAAILIGIGVITFISANDWILKLLNSSAFLKIFLMVLVTFSSFAGGYKLAYENKKFPKLGNCLIVLSTLLIGGTYALLGQIYNVNANSSALMLIWLVSILPVAYLFKNYAVNIISIVLFVLGIIFFYVELALDNSLIWTVFIPILCGTLLYTCANFPVVLNKYSNFSLSYKIVGILPIFITLLILTCSVEASYCLTSPFYIAPIAALLLFNPVNCFMQEKSTTLLKIETIFMTSLSVFLLLILILPSVNEPFVMFLANAAIIAMIALGFNYGYKFENGKIIGVTNWMLIIFLIVNYCRWGWSFMDKALFFILGGIFFLAIGLFLESSRKKVIGKGK